ncbi:MAG: response regulator [Chthoniobacterales bacterium]|nr:response regulator [Chthoniobacterales bacterium]
MIASRKPAWIADVTVQSAFPRREVARKSGLHGALLFPLLASSGVNGVIELLSDSVLAPDEDLLRLAGALGIEIGLYIERKRSEEELRRQKEAAEEANQAKDRFLAALSHELRTPLNPVLMWACATAQDKTLDDDMKEGLRMVCRNVEMEARLIDDLLDLTRIARGKLQLNLQPCDAGALLQHALEIVRSQLTGKNLHAALDLQASNHEIMADATRIEQVFWNLLKNANKFTPENGEIVVRSYDAAPGVLAFEISDSGRGIDPALMPKLFTAFEQGIRGGGGLGLGLAICKAIVQMHGGKIYAANKPDGPGAVFTIELIAVADRGVNAPLTSRAEAVPWRTLRILIVEDHGHTAAVMSSLLKREGHDVLSAPTVREALDILRSRKLDLLVSDLGLPDGNGFEVMRELAKISDAKGIAVSGYGMDEDIQRSSDAGFSAHLTKPINVQELQETIQRVTSET